ncbi:hypothetical protein P9597_17505 [Aneurinibacillus migulanus]|uniref:hypothetical protein n=1 Tax=Aneurinibacillus migulanus TaxID=47500 RepID=UPI002E1E78F4|nr:hypothetical protein [Aneurinibacillus migulanus]
MRTVKLARAIDNEESRQLAEWLEKYIFPNDFLEDKYFESYTVLYSADLKRYFTLFQSIVHNPKPATFSPEDVNDALLKACNILNVNEGCRYFNVNVHDNIARTIDSIGKYSLKRHDTPALFPLYYLLTENRAKEGGTSYTGLIGKNKDWMITIEFENEIVFKFDQKYCFKSNFQRNTKSCFAKKIN